MGGVAQLTLAVQPDGTQLVIRELLPRYILNWRMHRRFVKGTRIRERISPHPRIAYSVERGYQGLKPYEVIEYVDGKNLRELILARHPLIRSHTYQILRQSASALAYMHDRGILHLDVKAENFLLDMTTEQIKVKLTDFDLSCDLKTSRDRHRSGTLSYMAPEQVRQGAVGVGSDMFAFGIFAYFLVTGKMPFTGDSEKERRQRQLSMESHVISPRRVNPDLSAKLDWIIMRCLEKDPEKRFPGMAYLQQELGG